MSAASEPWRSVAVFMGFPTGPHILPFEPSSELPCSVCPTRKPKDDEEEDSMLVVQVRIPAQVSG